MACGDAMQGQLQHGEALHRRPAHMARFSLQGFACRLQSNAEPAAAILWHTDGVWQYHAGPAAVVRMPCRRHAQQRMACCSLKSSAGWLASRSFCRAMSSLGVMLTARGPVMQMGPLSSTCQLQLEGLCWCVAAQRRAGCRLGDTWAQRGSVMQGRLLQGERPEDSHGTALEAHGQRQPARLWLRAAASRKAGAVISQRYA